MFVLCASVPIFYVSYYYFHTGDFLPNTYYLKLSGGHFENYYKGLLYSGKTLIEGGANIFVFSTIILGAYLHRINILSRRESVFVLGLLLLTIYIVYTGGDVFTFGRFYWGVVPVSMFFFVDWIFGFKKNITHLKFPKILCLVGFVFLAISSIYVEMKSYYGNTFYPRQEYNVKKGVNYAVHRDYRFEQLALIFEIREHVAPHDGGVGLFWLGALGYYLPEYEIADFLGKADDVISRLDPVAGCAAGHNKWNFRHTVNKYNVAVIPVLESALNLPSSLSQQCNFFQKLVDDPYVKERFKFLSSKELGYNVDWGLLVRNDLLPRFQTGR